MFYKILNKINLPIRMNPSTYVHISFSPNKLETSQVSKQTKWCNAPVMWGYTK